MRAGPDLRDLHGRQRALRATEQPGFSLLRPQNCWRWRGLPGCGCWPSRRKARSTPKPAMVQRIRAAMMA